MNRRFFQASNEKGIVYSIV